MDLKPNFTRPKKGQIEVVAKTLLLRVKAEIDTILPSVSRLSSKKGLAKLGQS